MRRLSVAPRCSAPGTARCRRRSGGGDDHRIFDVDCVGQCGTEEPSSGGDAEHATDEMLMTEAPMSAAVRTAMARVRTSPTPPL